MQSKHKEQCIKNKRLLIIFTLLLLYNAKFFEPFSVWYPIKGHTYLTNLQLSAAGLVKYVQHFSGHQALKLIPPFSMNRLQRLRLSFLSVTRFSDFYDK